MVIDAATRNFWMLYRSMLIEQEKGLRMQLAGLTGQRKSIEKMLGMDVPSPTPLNASVAGVTEYKE